MLDGVPPSLDPAACPACGSELELWRTVPASEPLLGTRRYRLWRCRACGTAVTAPPAAGGDAGPADPDTTELHRSGAYRMRVPHLHGLVAPILALFDRERLGLLGRVAAPGATVIDAGAGQGRFIARAREAGYAASGFDPHPRGDGVAAGSLESAELAPGSAGVVCLWHVLEHVEDPGAALARVREWLAPGGAVIIAVPNLASWQARVGGERWFHLDVPRHRVHFTDSGLCRLLVARGYAVVGVEQRLREHNPYGLWQSVVNRLGRSPSWLFQRLKGNAGWEPAQLLLTAAALPLIPVAYAIERLAGARGRGGTIVVLARRTD